MQEQQSSSFFKTAWQRSWRFFRKYWKRFQITRWLIVMVLFFTLVSVTYLTVIAKTSHVRSLQSNLSRSTVIYDQNHDEAGKLYAQKGSYVSMQQISPHLPAAILSTEDRNFYHEHGFSVKGYGRAIFQAVGNKLMGRNQISGGGSTISQQLAKNTFLSQQQTLSRKFKELFISIEIENVYSKEQILTMYMNNAYFGNGIYGVQDASRKYFGKNASELPVQDAAVLAGMLQNPSNNPIDHPAAAKQRRNLVLELMGANKKLTKAQVKHYQSLPLGTKDTFENKNGYKYPYYFDAVINEAINQYGISEKAIMNNGYKIYTNLNQQQQASFQTDFKNPNLFPQNAADGTKVQAASIALNPKNGGVQAVVGGRNNDVFRGFNRATDIKRQPGSTMKPLAVYTPALEHGFSYDSKLVDKKQSYGKNNYSPNNYNNQYEGEVPMYRALAESRNAPAVWTLNKIGVQNGFDSVQKFGLPVTKKDDNLALALGGLSTGVSPQQMAGAYTAFANQGQVSKPFYITKIVDSTGKTVATNSGNTTQIMSAATAKEMTSMMLGVFDYGTGATAKPAGYQVAGKTGSTEADSSQDADATRDKWIIGYTPDVVVATWEGFDNTNADHHLENLSGTGVNSLFKQQMQQILPLTDQSNFNTEDAQQRAEQKQKRQKQSFSGSDLTHKAEDVTKDIEKRAAGVAQDFYERARSFLGK
ncbi:transglycosylase domain-containing protein [Fructilactobacillus florum]|uniref:Penicillin-binding protein, 1A family n=1 Tax=Fructilactobacillus florum DSM 22689 = JCM 16035 TaxID=1423745 RepID=A0A0R2CL78_9LACO|nr:PBP1A family penicillin-binding protein [Fructilactobacillus florum]KRM91858.1 penicillin-binding protein, 1A family [Fructilactobacillus florum DSM 22689 = JCM 16035]